MARRKKGDPVHGWINLDKPEDVTSTQAVSRVRRALGAQKAGHAGTLDPLASGILPIALGEATKTVPYAMDSDKVYRFEVEFGVETDTCDREGHVIARSDMRPTRTEIEAVLPDFTGLIAQVPPKFSAIKIDGERAYDLARDGEEVILEPRHVNVFGLALIEMPNEAHATFEVETGKGFYVRSFGRDLGKRLGTVSHISKLRRTRVGGFDEAHAISLESLEALGHSARHSETLLPCETALDDIPAVAITEVEARRLKQGQPIAALPVLSRQGDLDVEQGDVVAAMSFHRLVALAEVQGGEIRPSRVFNLDT